MIKAIIDTCFLQKFHQKGRFSDDFKLIVNAGEFELCIHPYVYDSELSMFSFVTSLLKQGICRIVDYNEFIGKEHIKMYYTGLYYEIYNEFYDRLKVICPSKAEKMHKLDKKTDIFTYRHAGSSLGDVHMVLMALFMNIPIILSEDSDMELIFRIASKKINSDKYELEVYRIKDVSELISSKENCLISASELKRIRRAYAR